MKSREFDTTESFCEKEGNDMSRVTRGVREIVSCFLFIKRSTSASAERSLCRSVARTLGAHCSVANAVGGQVLFVLFESDEGRTREASDECGAKRIRSDAFLPGEIACNRFRECISPLVL